MTYAGELWGLDVCLLHVHGERAMPCGDERPARGGGEDGQGAGHARGPPCMQIAEQSFVGARGCELGSCMLCMHDEGVGNRPAAWACAAVGV